MLDRGIWRWCRADRKPSKGYMRGRGVKSTEFWNVPLALVWRTAWRSMLLDICRLERKPVALRSTVG